MAITTPIVRTMRSVGCDWTLNKPQQALLTFTRSLIALRQKHPVFRRRRFFQGRRIRGAEVKDLYWLRPDGKEMTDDDWAQGYVRCLGVRLAGDAMDEKDSKGRPLQDETFLVLLNAHHEPGRSRCPRTSAACDGNRCSTPPSMTRTESQSRS